MKGTVLQYDSVQRKGLVVAENGERYEFNLDEWKATGAPSDGLSVDFVGKEDFATQIFTITTQGQNSSNLSPLAEQEKSGKQMAMIIYGLYGASLVLGITYFIGVILAYIKKDDYPSEMLKSHFRWQIRTFWFSMLWSLIGIILLFVVVGWFVLIANLLWIIYRIVRGAISLNDNKKMYM